jgi:hypothetical protein
VNPGDGSAYRRNAAGKPAHGFARRVGEAWDAEYESGRYDSEPAVGFVDDIIAAAQEARLARADGLYIGCGNGRNYLPLVSAGLDLIGLDLSGKALDGLARRAPNRRQRLIQGDLSSLDNDARLGIVVGIQVFQHGDRKETHSHIRRAQRMVAPGGLFCLRVNAVGTDVFPDHEVVEQNADSGFTVRYLEGPKEGLLIHFFSRGELENLFAEGFQECLPLGLDVTWRDPRSDGQWSQWEAIWRKRHESDLGWRHT